MTTPERVLPAALIPDETRAKTLPPEERQRQLDRLAEALNPQPKPNRQQRRAAERAARRAATGRR